MTHMGRFGHRVLAGLSDERGSLVLHPDPSGAIEDGQCECSQCGEWFLLERGHDCEVNEYWEWLARQI